MQNGNLKTQVASGMTWKLVEKLLSQCISFVLSLILARILAPSDYGTVAMINIFISIADVVITSGFSVSLIQKEQITDKDYATAFYCNLSLSLILYLILFTLAPTIAKMYEMPELVMLLRVVALKLPISAYNSIQNAHISRNMQFKKSFFSTCIGTLLSGVLGVIMAIKGFGAWALVVQQISLTAFNTLVLLFVVNWYPKTFFSKKSFRSMLAYSSKTMGTDIVGAGFNQLNSFIIGLKYSTSDLAYYNKGQQLPCTLSAALNTSATTVLFSAISKCSNDYDNVKRIARKTLKAISFLLFPMMIGIVMVSNELVVILYTEKWIDMVPYLIVFSLSEALSVIGSIDVVLLKAIGMSGTTLKLEFIKKPIYIVVVLLAMQFGVYYILFSVLIVNFIGMLINSISTKKTINYGFGEKLFDCGYAFISSFLMCAVVYLVNFLPVNSVAISLILKVMVGCFVYLLIALLSKNKIFKELILFIKAFVRRKV